MKCFSLKASRLGKMTRCCKSAFVVDRCREQSVDARWCKNPREGKACKKRGHKFQYGKMLVSEWQVGMARKLGQESTQVHGSFGKNSSWGQLARWITILVSLKLDHCRNNMYFANFSCCSAHELVKVSNSRSADSRKNLSFYEKLNLRNSERFQWFKVGRVENQSPYLPFL